MTADQYTRAALARFAFEETDGRGDLRVMKAVCYVMRNRVRRGWHDGSWHTNIVEAHQTAAHETARRGPTNMLEKPEFLRLLRDIDDIFYGGEEELSFTLGQTKERGPALFYQFIGEPVTEWFTENIVRGVDHAQAVILGKMVLFT